LNALEQAPVSYLVNRGLEVVASIASLETELKGIEAELKQRGLKARHEELKDPEREGRRWLAQGSLRAVPVVFTADKIVGEFKDASPLHNAIKKVAGPHLASFFVRVVRWENRFDDGKYFRAEAETIFGNHAGAFVNACLSRDKDGLPKSDIKILWNSPE
jgi:hypothetical protein